MAMPRLLRKLLRQGEFSRNSESRPAQTCASLRDFFRKILRYGRQLLHASKRALAVRAISFHLSDQPSMDPPAPYERFRHEPLNLSENSFRLLDINGVSSDGFIECTINQYNRDQFRQSYRALSYTWGPETPAGWILLNGKAFRARENLLWFLQSTFTHREARKGIWIDAVCIDQENTPERNHQVKQMADIYRNAETVFAWLGPSEEDYRELVKLLNKFQAEPPDRLADGSALIEELFMSMVDPAGMVQMLDVIQRPYWGRMWIIQEITLPETDVLLLIGQHSVSWFAFKRACIMTANQEGGMELDWVRPPCRVAKVADLLKTKSRPLAILGLLRELDGGGDCREVHDKIYGLLGMASDAGLLEPDYTITTAELFFRVLQSEYSLVETNTITIDDVSFLRRVLNIGFEELRAYLDAKKSQGYAEETIRCKAGGKKLYQHWCPPYSSVALQFDYDCEIDSSIAQIHPLDVAFNFAANHSPNRDLILRQTSNGLFTFAAVAEYEDSRHEDSRHEDSRHEDSGDEDSGVEDSWDEDEGPGTRCFIYGLPELQSVPPFEFRDSFISVPASVVVFLTKLAEMYPLGSDSRNQDGLRPDIDKPCIRYRKDFQIWALDEPEEQPSSICTLETPRNEYYDGYKKKKKRKGY